MSRFYVDMALDEPLTFCLPPEAARHAQVLRLQRGDTVVLFNGEGLQWTGQIEAMASRGEVWVALQQSVAPAVELPLEVTLAVGMPANDRMDNLVEKAAELGAAGLQPLVCERSVLKLEGERASRRVTHWTGVATAACEQSGRVKLPQVHPVRRLKDWLDSLPSSSEPVPARFVLSFAPDAQRLPAAVSALREQSSITLLSGPEGGLSSAEEALARSQGFVPVTLGPRVLRADTAPLAALAVIGALCEGA